MMTYLLKSSVCLAFVYVVYLSLFRYTNRFQLNRMYLLIGLALSLVAPMMILPATPVDVVTTFVSETYSPGDNSYIKDVVSPVAPARPFINYIYFAGVVISLLITLNSILKILKIYWTSEKIMHDGYTVVVSHQIDPFSFFGILFLRSHKEDPMIITHEMVHIRQRHWIDLALAEIGGIVPWFNPVVHLYRRSMVIQHEYLADRAVVSGTQVENYLGCILNQLESSITSNLVNRFNTQSIKQRIIMITNSNKYSALRYALVLPIVTIFVMAFATQETNDIVPIQKREFRCPVDASKLKAGEGVCFGNRIHPATNTEQFHRGVDFKLERGSSVYAAGQGTVVKAADSGDYGNLVVIRHGKLLTTYYAHLEKILVKAGDRVDAGQLIGTVGSTGSSIEPHLHFELLENSKPVDPVPYLDMSID